MQLARESSMEVVIIRAPLVYGPGVRANFYSLMRSVKRGIPLPLGALDNRRSLIALDNLVDLIIVCMEHSAAANKVFMAADDHDLSTAELIRLIAEAIGKPPRLIPVPVAVLVAVARIFGKQEMVRRLCGSLQVDITRTKNLLDWRPPLSVEEGIRKTVAAAKW